MLARLPPEILSHITFYLCITQPPSSDAIPPIPLFQTCRTIYDAVALETNKRLYTRVFKALFDVGAAERRFGWDKTGRGNQGNGGGRLRAQDWVDELRRRVEALSRLKARIEQKNVAGVTDEELWVVYFMLTENDGKNIKHLMGRQAMVDLPAFLDLYHRQHLLAAALAPGYPKETVGRSVAMWIGWLVLESDETPEQREERQYALRPYVFAAPRYDVYFAPWTLPTLPTLGLHALLPVQQESSPYVADLVPRSRGVKVNIYGRTLSLCPPLISQAAILRFFHCGLEEELDSDSASMAIAAFVSRKETAEEEISSGQVTPTPGDHSGDSTAGFEAMRLHGNSVNPFVSSSAIHDRDFFRLLTCYDPTITLGMPRSIWRGCWEGCWEGSFSFFDFDAFREMLSGQAKVLYDGPYGEQAQVWKLRETWVRRAGWKRAPMGRRRKRNEAESVDGFEEGKLAVNGPMLNAGFPTDQISPLFDNQPTFAATEAATLRESIKQQLDALEGYEQVPDAELDGMMQEEDGGQKAGLELLLTGTGHSAWGNFILKGRVRAWDGMASLVKEYAPDSRGKWIYRGYVLAGDVFVGRWRDTYTPEAYVGYEGAFILNRR
ncbi:hypothetical protein L204_103412 [Cryptococcus depauperatus]